VAPPGFPSPIELAEIMLPAGARVTYDSGPRAAAVSHQVWVIAGSPEHYPGVWPELESESALKGPGE